MEPCKTINVPPCPLITITAETTATVEGESVKIERPDGITTIQMVGTEAAAVAQRINDEVASFADEIRGSIGGQPNRGEPSRGKPNRGTPNRGEPNRGR